MTVSVSVEGGGGREREEQIIQTVDIEGKLID